MSWQDRFNQKLQAKQQAKLEQKRDISAYGEWIANLFDQIAAKVSGIEAIKVQRPMAARTGEFRDNVSGQLEAIKAMTLRCEGEIVELIPEGINFAFGKGRVRIVHKIKDLSEYLYLYLVVDPASQETYPGNLRWVINDGGEEQPTGAYPPFDEGRIERLIEAAFLAED